MHHIKTLAIAINKNTYPIAVACLPPGFTQCGFYSVKGNILVINDVSWTRERKSRSGDRVLKLGNSYMNMDVFIDRFGPSTGVNDVMFVEVTANHGLSLERKPNVRN